jgi:hypothetical protein
MAITLSSDELHVFLALLGATALNGLDSPPFAGLSEQEVAQQLDDGRKSLVERGLLTLPVEHKKGILIDDVLVALVGASLVPEATLIVTETCLGGAPDIHYFSATPELLVEHRSPSTGKFRFELVPGAGALAARLHSLLAPVAAAAGSADGAVETPAAAMTAFMAHCARGRAENARQALVEAGCAAELAVALSDDVQAGRSWAAASAWGLRQRMPEGADAAVAIVGRERCWLIRNSDHGPERVNVRQASGTECAESLEAMGRRLGQVRHTGSSKPAAP